MQALHYSKTDSIAVGVVFVLKLEDNHFRSLEVGIAHRFNCNLFQPVAKKGAGFPSSYCPD